MSMLSVTCSALWGRFLRTVPVGFLVAAAALSVHAVTPTDLGFINVKDFGAVGNGTTNDTSAIQNALDAGFLANRAVYFPAGTYRIVDTLRCAQWRGWDTAQDRLGENPFKTRSYKLVGEHGGDRAVIRLIPNASTAAKFGDSHNPRPMILLRHYEAQGPGTTYPATWEEWGDIMGKPDGWDLDTPSLFGCELRNIDFDCNGHDGAIGVSWPGAQGGVVESVKVNATGAHAGFYGLPGRHWGAINIEVEGGEYGVRCGFGAGGNPESQLECSGVVITGAKFTNQTRLAIDYSDFVPLVMTGFEIRKNFDGLDAPGSGESPIKLQDSGSTANNSVCLLDGSIELINAPSDRAAIDNPGIGASGKSLYVRNVYVTGTTKLVSSAGGVGMTATGGSASNWNRINEYSFADMRGIVGPFPQSGSGTTYRSFATYRLQGGAASRVVEPVGSSGFALNTGLATDLRTRHLPDGGFPYYEGDNSPATLVVTRLTEIPGWGHGDAVPGIDTPEQAENNRKAIQAAIDHASIGAGRDTYHGRVFIPHGVFYIQPEDVGSNPSTTTPALRMWGNTKLFGAGKWGKTILMTQSNWKPTTAVGVMVETEDAEEGTAYLGSLDFRVSQANNPFEYPFTYLHWRVGPGSMTHDLVGRCDSFKNAPNVSGVPPFQLLRFTGSAGGRHYFLPWCEQQFSKDDALAELRTAAYRTVQIEGTRWPLWFYGFNAEGAKRDARDTDVEIKDARNVVMLGFKREGRAPMLRIDRGVNIMLLGAGAMRENAVSRVGDGSPVAYVEVVNAGSPTNGGSNRLLMANLLVQSIRDEPSGYTLRTSLIGGGASGNGGSIEFPLGVSHFMRGTFSYDEASPKTRVLVLASIAGDDGYVIGDSGGTSVSATGSGNQALRVGDDNTNKQYKTILSFDTTSVGIDAFITEASLMLRTGTLKGSMGGFPDTFTADIVSGSFGTNLLQTSDFNAAATEIGVADLDVPGAAGEEVVGILSGSAIPSINRSGPTQFRLYFPSPYGSDSDGVADYIGFYSGNDNLDENWPLLRIVYR